MQYSDLGRYLFASVQNGIVGSLYYEYGRIRLVHKYGPCIEIYGTQNRLQFVINNNNKWRDFYKNIKGTMTDICSYMSKMDSYILDTSSIQALEIFPKERIENIFIYGSKNQLDKYYLFELFFRTEQLTSFHPSRGYPDTSIHYGNRYASQLEYVFNSIMNDEVLGFAQRNMEYCESKYRIDAANTKLYCYCKAYMPTLKLYNPQSVYSDSVIQDYIK